MQVVHFAVDGDAAKSQLTAGQRPGLAGHGKLAIPARFRDI